MVMEAHPHSRLHRSSSPPPMSCPEIRRSNTDVASNQPIGSTDSPSIIYVISPTAVIASLSEQYPHAPIPSTVVWKEFSLKRMRSHSGHVSTEDWPKFDGSTKDFIGNLELAVYKISCL